MSFWPEGEEEITGMECDEYAITDVFGARIAGYSVDPWNIYLCAEKDGKHYMIVFSHKLASAKSDSRKRGLLGRLRSRRLGPQIAAIVLGPKCERSQGGIGVWKHRWQLDRSDVWDPLIYGVIRAARNCWRKGEGKA